MPLVHSSSPAALGRNLHTLYGEVGKSPHVQSRAQALAIGLETQRRSRASGGVVPGYDAGGTVGDPVNQVISALQQGVSGNGMGTSTMGAPSTMNGMPQPAMQPAGVAPPPTMGPQPSQPLAPVPGAPSVTPMNSGTPQNAPMGGIATPVNNPMTRPMMASGGMATGGFNVAKSPHLTPEGGAKMVHGPILSDVPGRTDRHHINVPSASYVVPADVISGRGEGNTLAGMNFWQKAFHMGPFGSSAGTMSRGPGAPHAPRFRDGGGASGKRIGVPTPVVVAGGELIIPAGNLMKGLHSWLGYHPKNIDHAHELMDGLMISERKKLRKTLAKLPGPAKD